MNRNLSKFLGASFVTATLIGGATSQAQRALRINIGCPSIASPTMCETLRHLAKVIDERNVALGDLTGGIRPPIPRDEFAKLESLASRAALDIQRTAKTQQAKMSDAEFDKFMMEKSRSAGTPQNVLGAVSAAGGPSRVFANAERTLNEVTRDLRSEFKVASNEITVDKVLAAITFSGSAEAKFGGLRCSLAIWALTMGQGTDANYKLCMR
jgi:hypothetical protein